MMESITFERAQLGWRCSIGFAVTTASQFTDERHEVTDGCHGHSVFSLLLAFWRARRAMKARRSQLRAKPGERAAKGWAA